MSFCSFLQVLLPLLVCCSSLLYLFVRSIHRTVQSKRDNAYKPIDNDALVFGIPCPPGGQGSVREENGDIEDDPTFALERTKSGTDQSMREISRPRGEKVIVVVEILALLGEIGINLAALLTRAWGDNGTPAAIAGLGTWGYIFALASVRLLFANSKTPAFSKLWNHTAILYGFQWLFTVLLFRSAIIHPRSRRAQIFMIIDFTLATLLGLIALTTKKGNKAVVLEYEDHLEPSREPLASLFSLATFGWVDAIVWKGYMKTLELSDIWNLAPKDKASRILADYRQTRKTTKLAWHLLKYFKRGLLIQAAWACFSGFFTFAPTLLLKVILEYVEDPSGTPANAAWFYVILLAVSGCTQALADGQALWTGRKVCIRLRAVIIGEIYAKALRRKAAAGSDTVLGEKRKDVDKIPKQGLKKRIKSFGRKQKDHDQKPKPDIVSSTGSSDSQVNTGTIINLMAVDSFKVSEISAYLHFLWASVPVQIIVAITLLYKILGYSSVAGIGMMVLLLPLNIVIARQFSKTQKVIMAATDARIHTTNEVLQNIRIIKYFAWEQRFAQIVNDKRRTELRALRRRYILWTVAATVWYGAPIMITFLSFFIYTAVEKKDLIPSVAFTALSLFSILRIPLDQLADMLAHVQESKVSVDRVEEFLNEDETQKYAQLLHDNVDETGEPIIGFDSATFTWGGKDALTQDGTTAFRMIDMNIRFKVGQLNVVAGPTGSGKTSLLMALLGEMTLLSGRVFLPGGHSREDLSPDSETGLTESVAYCAQQAWLVNDTIKQNILFASPWDEQRYNAVISACALERDLEILDSGDQTLVGEKGITLSGGQKQRLSLARALYCNSRHVLLDDCLSAVDSHTAKHIFENCIMGPLMYKRTCILVTHNVALCVPRSRHVVVLNNGKVAHQGSAEEVLSSGALGEDFLKSRPASKGNSQKVSRVPSTDDLGGRGSVTPHGEPKQANGTAKGTTKTATANDKGHSENENANTRTEGKAEGGVKPQVIRLYLSAMGRWYYWIIAVAVFAAQQIGSVATNVWIREWANSYHTRNVHLQGAQAKMSPVNNIRGMSNHISSSCLSSGTCAWNIPLFAEQSSKVDFAVTSPEVNVSYYLGVYALLGVIYMVICLLREGVLFWGSIAASWKIHERLLNSVSRAQFRFFDSTPLGQLMNRFSKDIEALDQEVATVAVGMLHCLATVVTIVILISVITPGFLIAGIFITAIYFAIGKFYIRSSRDLKRLESVQRSPLYQQFGETLSGITTIRAYGDERRFIRDNQNRVNTHSRPFIYLWATNRWLAFRVDIAGALVAFFSGVFIILSVGKIDAGAAGLSLTYAVTFTENVLWLVRLYASNEQNMNSVERIKEYLDVEQEAKAIITETRPAANWPSRGAVQFVGYSTRYRADLEPVLRNVTFNVLPAEKVGIVGRTGAGKSSLALALFRGLEAESGKILIDDVDIGLIGLQDLRESITIVPQDPTLFTGTIRSNVDPFGLFTDDEIFTALRRVHLIGSENSFSSSTSRPSSPTTPRNATPTPPSSPPAPTTSPPTTDADADLTKTLTNARDNANIFLNLHSPIAESGSNLSQGQRQLLCLARALLKSPRVLLMDEATASIDYVTDAKIQTTLRELRNSTIVTIAHRLQTIIDYDKVLVLEKGEVVEFDSPWELVRREGGVFRGMCEMSGDLEGLVEGARRAVEGRRLVDDGKLGG